MMSKKAAMKAAPFRIVSQLALVGLIAFIGIRHQITGGGPRGSAPLDSYCPFGGIETLIYYLQTGHFLQKTNFSNFVLLASVVVLAIIAGSVFCSWLCPFGSVQEWLAKLGRKIFGRNFNVPVSMHRPLRYLRYVVLILVVYVTVRGFRLVFEDYDPFKALFHFNIETATTGVILAATVIFSILVDRSWCKYLCPLGGVLSILGKFNLINLRRNPEECIDCGLCTRKCPMDIQVESITVIPPADCTKCLDCVDACPCPGALTLTVGGGK